MTAEDKISEEELEEQLRTDPMFGMQLLHVDYRDRIARYIKRRGRSLDSEEIKDLYQQTMLEMIESVRKPDFDPERPLRLVLAIAKRRTIDYLRRKGYRANTNHDAILPHVAEDLGKSDINLRWRYLDRMRQKEFRPALEEEIAKLPERQRIVATAYVDNFEDFRERDTYLPLARAVSAITNKDENVVAVKSAWHEAKRKLVKELTRRGFDFLEEN